MAIDVSGGSVKEGLDQTLKGAQEDKNAIGIDGPELSFDVRGMHDRVEVVGMVMAETSPSPSSDNDPILEKTNGLLDLGVDGSDETCSWVEIALLGSDDPNVVFSLVGREACCRTCSTFSRVDEGWSEGMSICSGVFSSSRLLSLLLSLLLSSVAGPFASLSLDNTSLAIALTWRSDVDGSSSGVGSADELFVVAFSDASFVDGGEDGSLTSNRGTTSSSDFFSSSSKPWDIHFDWPNIPVISSSDGLDSSWMGLSKMSSSSLTSPSSSDISSSFKTRFFRAKTSFSSFSSAAFNRAVPASYMDCNSSYENKEKLLAFFRKKINLAQNDNMLCWHIPPIHRERQVF